MRQTRAGITSRMAGCFVCHGDAVWTGKNALALAARHHDATKHPTWYEQVMSVRYGELPTDEAGAEDNSR